ncbi:MAG: class I SAM-dependent methyltransferase [Chloroflexota bacterium]
MSGRARSAAQLNRYEELHERYPGTAKGVGWGSEQAQLKRFQAACEAWDLRNTKVLDAGCGYGDLVPHVIAKGVYSYTGIDTFQPFLRTAEAKWGHVHEGICFKDEDLVQKGKHEWTHQMYDVVFCIGLVGLKDRVTKPTEALQEVMEAAFNLATKAVVVTAIPPWTPGFTEGIVTIDPSTLIGMAHEMTPRVVYRSDYLPTDHMVYLYRELY